MRLTSVERVNRMLRREDHDRVPRYDLYWPETIERWQQEGLEGDADTVHDLLQADLRQLTWFEPRVYPGRSEVLSQTETQRVVLTEYGARLREWKGLSRTPEHLGFGCDSRRKWEQEYRPAALAAGVQVNRAEVRRNYAQAQQEGRWAMVGCIEGYEFMKRLIGDEIALVAMAEDPDWIVDLSRVATDLLILNLEAILADGMRAEGVFLSGDLAYNHAPLFSPAMYDALLRPDHERLVRWFHEHEMGIIFHTDGNVNLLVDRFIEVGFDSLHPLEACAHMDVRELAPRFGHRLSFWGNMDKMVTGAGDREQVEHEVRSKLAAGMVGRGYGFHSDHSVPPSVSWGTYRFMIELVERYGNYE